MNISLNTAAVCLAKDQMLSLINARGSLINCSRGALWITQDHDLRDIELSPGQSFTLDRDGVAMVSALVDATVELLPAQRFQANSTTVQHQATHPRAPTASRPTWGGLAQLFN